MKINVIGTSGSGKSTFSKEIASTLKIPYIEMDKLFWGPNWYWPSDAEFFPRVEEACKQPSWVLDGNYTRTIPIKWQEIDLVIWLDYSFPTTLWQAIKRATVRAWTQQELWEGTGNRESFRNSFFSKKSIIWWTITQHGPVRRKYELMMETGKYEHIKFVRIRSHTEAREFLRKLANDYKVK